MIRTLSRSPLRHVLGRADEAWFWFYQWALSRLDFAPSEANVMYDQPLNVAWTVPHSEWCAAVHDLAAQGRDEPE